MTQLKIYAVCSEESGPNFDFWLRLCHCYVTEKRMLCLSMHCNIWQHMTQLLAFQEMLLSPVQFGIPNSRLRYYLLAKLSPRQFPFPTSSKVTKRCSISSLQSKTQSCMAEQIMTIGKFQQNLKLVYVSRQFVTFMRMN